MNNFEFDDYSKPKKIRKTKVHREKVYFDDDVDEVHTRKQAGKKKHSRNMNQMVEYGLEDDDELEQYKQYLK